MDILQTSGARFNLTGQTASGSASVTRAATSGVTYYITDIVVSSNASTATVDLYAGNTVYFQCGLETNQVAKSFVIPIRITTGSAVTLRAATAEIQRIYLGGYSI